LAQRSPTLALESVMRETPLLDPNAQRHMLEGVLALIPKDQDSFGFFDLSDYEQVLANNKNYMSDSPAPAMLWTHQVWNELAVTDGRESPINLSTRHYVQKVTSSTAFYILLSIGIFTFALSGVLEAINRGYDIWGRLILAFLSGLGGGTLRDFLIGGDRLPPEYVRDLTHPIGIIAIVFVTTVIAAIYKDLHKTSVFKSIKTYVDIIGFSVLAIAGAMFSISSGLPLLWAPICAALSCAGGGMLRDIVVNQEPATFKGVIYEELAVIGALIFVAGLLFANTFEQTALPVYITVASCMILIAISRFLVYKFEIRYPKILTMNRQ